MNELLLKSPAATRKLGLRLGAVLEPFDFVALTGDLGAGKTHLVKGLAHGLGVVAEITSPTFTLIHEHTHGKIPLYHIDLYRLDSPDEALKIGLDEYLDGDGVTVIEWADKFPVLIPSGAQWISLHQLDEDSREIITSAKP